MEAIASVARHEHLMIEGAAALSLAALSDERLTARKVSAIVSGRNISLDLFSKIILKSEA
jgi:threonine dehydratase